MRILVTGSRHHSDYSLIKSALQAAADGEEHTLVNGGASGADSLARRAAEELGWTVETYPADWETYGKRAGYLRNKQMVDSQPDLCLAFPLGVSRGTWMTVKLCGKANIPVKVYRGEA